LAIWLGEGPRCGEYAGCVVQIDGIDKDWFAVHGHGFIRSENFRLVDRDVLFIGTWVMDLYNEEWGKVVAVDSSDAISVHSAENRRSLLEFAFPVARQKVLTAPRVVCKDAFVSTEGLEQGKAYCLEKGMPVESGLVVINIEGASFRMPASKFLWDFR
jgi:hypothetical protein